MNECWQEQADRADPVGDTCVDQGKEPAFRVFEDGQGLSGVEFGADGVVCCLLSRKNDVSVHACLRVANHATKANENVGSTKLTSHPLDGKLYLPRTEQPMLTATKLVRKSW